MDKERVEIADPSRSPVACRRRVLAGAGAVGATALLAACGGAQGSGQGGEPADDDALDAQRPQGAIVAVDQVPVGGGFINTEQGVVVTRLAEDQWHAFSATCTHASCLVSSVSSSGIVCTCHGSTFSPTDGSVLGGPASSPLPAKAVSVRDGWVVSA